MALTFTYDLTQLGSSTKVLIHHGPQLGQDSDAPRFTLGVADGTLRVRCLGTGLAVVAGKVVVVDHERGITYCGHCANGEVGGQIVAIRPA